MSTKFSRISLLFVTYSCYATRWQHKCKKCVKMSVAAFAKFQFKPLLDSWSSRQESTKNPGPLCHQIRTGHKSDIREAEMLQRQDTYTMVHWTFILCNITYMSRARRWGGGGGGLPFITYGDARRHFQKQPLKVTILGVAPANFIPYKLSRKFSLIEITQEYWK